MKIELLEGTERERTAGSGITDGAAVGTAERDHFIGGGACAAQDVGAGGTHQAFNTAERIGALPGAAASLAVVQGDRDINVAAARVAEGVSAGATSNRVTAGVGAADRLVVGSCGDRKVGGGGLRRERLTVAVQAGDCDRIAGITTSDHNIATACHQSCRIVADIGIANRECSTAAGRIGVGFQIAHRVGGTPIEIDGCVVGHHVGIDRDRVAGDTGGDRGVVAACGDADAVVVGVRGRDIQGSGQARAGDVADQIGYHLPGGTKQAQQGVLPELGGIGGHRVAAGAGGDRGGAAAGRDADGVVGGVCGGDRQSAAGIAGQHRSGEIGDGVVVGVGIA